MKRFLFFPAYVLLSVTFMLSFISCGGDDADDTSDVKSNNGNGDKVVIQDAVFSEGNWICVDIDDIPYFLNSQKRTACVGWPEGYSNIFEGYDFTKYFQKYYEGGRSWEIIVYEQEDYEYRGIIGKIVIPSKIIYRDVEYTVTCIGVETFQHQWGITDITIPSTILRIEERALGDCVGLTKVVIPSSVVYIGYHAFYDEFYKEKGIKDIYVQRSNPSEYNCDKEAFATVYLDREKDRIFKECTLHVPVGCKSKYSNIEPWSKFKKIVEN